jgi:hypothetical protein
MPSLLGVPSMATDDPPPEVEPSCAISNIEAFVASATPVFATNANARAREVSTSTSTYALSELFDAFEEPSAFGAEVPLRLQEGEDVSQYYVPFLSGLQLFKRDESGGTVSAYEFFEKASPYSRAALRETIGTILDENEELRSLTSDDLAPNSWMSVAWYPIYRIPQGTMLHDVQGCFLTYHALYVGELRDGDIACPLPPKMSETQEELIEKRVSRAKETAGENAQVHVLRPFGLSMYKMQGDVWAASESVTEWMNALMDGAYTWLRARKTVHPDYEFFSHFG